MPGVVCSAIAVQTVSMSCCEMPWPRRKSRAALRAVDLEPLVRAAVAGHQAHVVKHRAGIEQFAVEVQPAMLPASAPK